MRFQINHHTRYGYSRAVEFGPHTLRLRPRSDGDQRLVRFDIEIDPSPSLLTECLDAEGNTVTMAWFHGPADRLYIHTSAEVETTRGNPFDYLLTDGAAKQLPMVYNGSAPPHLEAYYDASGVEHDVAEFASFVARAVEGDTLQFLPALCRQVCELCDHEVRHTGEPQSAQLTLERGKGACRDLAVLFVEACRAQGLAARFVSGYQRPADAFERNEMHAWAEVYLPGGGWRGFDPSHGLAASDSLIAVAAGATPQLAAPVSGSYAGPDAECQFDFEIEIR